MRRRGRTHLHAVPELRLQLQHQPLNGAALQRVNAHVI